ncbi:hypothetical protein CXG81DRAFT_16822 [Caulochytrium protostelioides]|uniref:Uncharacterized protein n=1 Tax=Caulochytrium protostelioides TaxID=1555241 RepID=A0A4P9XDW7_9FUNG|nr:hypothetical protein CXG81DRAFT_16822 [Caulochytrium protostelioides]|eukprot:RKP03726.1 hypothetical protein CXG81DRAFT_16822 [Caulochytrium protostelioides]
MVSLRAPGASTLVLMLGLVLGLLSLVAVPAAAATPSLAELREAARLRKSALNALAPLGVIDIEDLHLMDLEIESFIADPATQLPKPKAEAGMLVADERVLVRTVLTYPDDTTVAELGPGVDILRTKAFLLSNYMGHARVAHHYRASPVLGEVRVVPGGGKIAVPYTFKPKILATGAILAVVMDIAVASAAGASRQPEIKSVLVLSRLVDIVEPARYFDLESLFLYIVLLIVALLIARSLLLSYAPGLVPQRFRNLNQLVTEITDAKARKAFVMPTRTAEEVAAIRKREAEAWMPDHVKNVHKTQKSQTKKE